MAANGAYSVNFSVIDNATKTINRINKSLASLQAPIKRLKASLTQFARLSGVTAVVDSFKNLGQYAFTAWQSLTRMIAPLATIASAASIGGMMKLVQATAQWAQELTNAAQQLGISPEALQNFQNAGRLVGVSADTMTQSIQSVGTAFYKAISNQAPEVNYALQSVGYSMDDIAKLHTRLQHGDYNVMGELYDKAKAKYKDIHQLEDWMAKTGMSPAMIPFLDQGAAGRAKLQARAAQNASITPKQLKDLNAFQQAWVDLTEAAEGFMNTITAIVAPAITPFLKYIHDWLDNSANRKWVADEAIAGIKAMGGFLSDVMGWLKDGGWDKITTIYEAIGGLKTVLIATGLVMAGPMISAIYGLGTALATLALNPVGAVIVAITALGVAGYELYQHWNQVKAWFEKLWEELTSMWKNNTYGLRTIVSILFPLGAILINNWKPVSGFFVAMWDGIKNAFEAGWDFIKPILDKIGVAIEWIGNSWVGRHLVAAIDAGTMGLGGGDGGAGEPRSPGTGAAMTGDRASRQVTAMEQLINGPMHLNPEQAAGIVGGLTQESGMGENMQEINPLDGGRGGLGIAQWTGPRRVQFEAWLRQNGRSATDFQANLDYLQIDAMRPDFANQRAALGQTNIPTNAARAWFPYESGGDPRAIYGRRGAFAEDAYQAYLRAHPAPTAPGQVPPLTPMGTRTPRGVNPILAPALAPPLPAAQPGDGTTPRTELDIRLHGFPPGTGATARTHDMPPPRISFPMPAVAGGL